MIIPAELNHILISDPEIMGGDICFIGTRIPVVMLLDNVAAGVPMEDFYDAYPDVTPQQCEPVIKWQNEQAASA